MTALTAFNDARIAYLADPTDENAAKLDAAADAADAELDPPADVEIDAAVAEQAAWEARRVAELTAPRASDLIDDGYGLRARGGLVYFG